MDLLFRRYANPFLLFDEMIASSRMVEFINKILQISNDEKENDTLWEFYLHKVFDKSYEAFLRENKRPNVINHEEPIDFETTIKTSMNMLQDFCPA